MSTDYMTMRDLSALDLFVESHARLTHTFELVRDRLAPMREKLGTSKPKIEKLTYDSEGRVAWAWVYLRNSPKISDNWRIAWGIRFPPDNSEWWAGVEPPLPEVPHAFVAVSAEKEPSLPVSEFARRNKIPTGWSTDLKEGELITSRPVHSFPSDPEAWATDFADWVVSEAERIRGGPLEMVKIL